MEKNGEKDMIRVQQTQTENVSVKANAQNCGLEVGMKLGHRCYRDIYSKVKRSLSRAGNLQKNKNQCIILSFGNKYVRF